nr:MAG: putative 5.8 kDa protein [Plant associated crinivirus 1]
MDCGIRLVLELLLLDLGILFTVLFVSCLVSRRAFSSKRSNNDSNTNFSSSAPL